MRKSLGRPDCEEDFEHPLWLHASDSDCYSSSRHTGVGDSTGSIYTWAANVTGHVPKTKVQQTKQAASI